MKIFFFGIAPKFSGRRCDKRVYRVFLRWVVLNITFMGAEKWWVKTSTSDFRFVFFRGKSIHLANPLRKFQGMYGNAEDGRIKLQDLKTWHGRKNGGMGSPHSWLRVTTFPSAKHQQFGIRVHQSPDAVHLSHPPVFNFPLRLILHQYWHRVVEATVKQLLKWHFGSWHTCYRGWCFWTFTILEFWIRGCVWLNLNKTKKNPPSIHRFFNHQ